MASDNKEKIKKEKKKNKKENKNEEKKQEIKQEIKNETKEIIDIDSKEEKKKKKKEKKAKKLAENQQVNEVEMKNNGYNSEKDISGENINNNNEKEINDEEEEEEKEKLTPEEARKKAIKKKKRRRKRKAKHIIESQEKMKKTKTEGISSAGGTNVDEEEVEGEEEQVENNNEVENDKNEESDENEKLSETQIQQASTYLTLWKYSKESWKFSKIRQTWILKHIYSEKAIPEKLFEIALEYLQDLKGNSRTLTVEQAKKIMETENIDEESLKFQRAVQLMQILS